MRESTTSAALKNILASAADTPPNRPAPLSSKQVNLQISPQNTHKSAVSFHKSEVQMSKVGDSTAPSSAALAAKDRIRKAVDAAKARNGPDVHSKNVTQRKR